MRQFDRDKIPCFLKQTSITIAPIRRYLLPVMVLSTFFFETAHADGVDFLVSLIGVGLQACAFSIASCIAYFYFSKSKGFRWVIAGAIFVATATLLVRLLVFRILGIEDYELASKNSEVASLILGFWIACFLAVISPLCTVILVDRKRYLIALFSLGIWLFPIAYPTYLANKAKELKATLPPQ